MRIRDALQQMSHLEALRLEVALIVRIWVCLDRDEFHDLQAVSFQSDHLFRIIREEAHLSHAEIAENLRADAVVPKFRGEAEAKVCLHRVEAFLLELVSVDL